jgi:hypothetical protein
LQTSLSAGARRALHRGQNRCQATDRNHFRDIAAKPGWRDSALKTTRAISKSTML